jgi:hypothetical protein
MLGNLDKRHLDIEHTAGRDKMTLPANKAQENLYGDPAFQIETKEEALFAQQTHINQQAKRSKHLAYMAALLLATLVAGLWMGLQLNGSFGFLSQPEKEVLGASENLYQD